MAEEKKLKKQLNLFEYNKQNILLIEHLDNEDIFKLCSQCQLNSILNKVHNDYTIVYNVENLTEEQKKVLGIKIPISEIEVY